MPFTILRHVVCGASLSFFACANSVEPCAGDVSSSSALALTGTWASYDTPPVSSMTIDLGAGGLLDVFGIATDNGSIVGDAQAVANGVWEPPGSLGGVAFTEIALGHNADGRFQLFGVGGGGLWTIWRTTEGGWSGWGLLGGGDLHHVAVASEADGRMLVIVAGQGNEHVSVIEQNAPNAGWGSFRDIGLASLTQLTATKDGNGVIAIAALDSDGEAIVAQETNPNTGAFSSFSSVGGWGSKLALAPTGSGDVQLYELGPDGSVWTQPRQAWRWQSWSRLGMAGAIDIAVGNGPQNRPIPFVVGIDHTIYQKDDGPRGWIPRGEGLFTRVAVANNQDGHLELVGLTTSGTLAHTWQTSWGANSWAGATAPPRGLRGNYGFLTDYSLMSEQEARGRIDDMVDTFGTSDVQFFDWFASYSSPTSGAPSCNGIPTSTAYWCNAWDSSHGIYRQTIEWYVDEIHRKGARAWAYVQTVMAENTNDLNSLSGILPNLGGNPRVPLTHGPYPEIFANAAWGNLQAYRWAPTVASLGFDGIHWDSLGPSYYDPVAETNGFSAYLQAAAPIVAEYGLIETFNFVDMSFWNPKLLDVLAFPYSEVWSDATEQVLLQMMATSTAHDRWGVYARYASDFPTVLTRWKAAPLVDLRYLLVGDGRRRLTSEYFPNAQPMTPNEISELQ